RPRLERRQFGGDHLEHRLDDEGNEGGGSIYQNGVWQGPVANRGTDEYRTPKRLSETTSEAWCSKQQRAGSGTTRLWRMGPAPNLRRRLTAYLLGSRPLRLRVGRATA